MTKFRTGASIENCWSPSALVSPRLVYRRVCDEDLDAFHRLIVDQHIRRFLLDGEVMNIDWSSGRISESDELFEAQRVGLWLVWLKDQVEDRPIGFCGFIRFDVTGPQPQLLYALQQKETGKGYATEITEALIEYASDHTHLEIIHSGVDEPNVASSRVLEKVGFQHAGSTPGAFGKILRYTLAVTRTSD